ncbi:MAG: 4-(cytidine 5'-diphospho)-2-C-methyl-D-erythritol kinase [Bacteroidales bacterium]|nr:4-(cytidine 5'-diphospho)-2-C-methyl-D-erythritol kinase [Bacteroidales bacterium]
MIFFPNAKINIGLFITSKRNDAYHNLESVFYPVGLSDILEIKEKTANDPWFANTGIAVDSAPEQNLCYRALKLMREKYRIPPVAFHLHKIIPFGAGLGGGSSDAAFTLKALNRLFHLNLDIHTLKELALQLGSDCPFFIENHPAFAWGKGNQLEPIQLPIQGKHLALVVPPFSIATPEAYRYVKPRKREMPLNKILAQTPPEQWHQKIQNDFETSVFKEKPELKEIKYNLYRKGALFASMSGSGSSIYGIFNDPPVLQEAFSGCYTWSGQLK